MNKTKTTKPKTNVISSTLEILIIERRLKRRASVKPFRLKTAKMCALYTRKKHDSLSANILNKRKVSV